MILVTGAAGFIGRHLVRRLRGQGQPVLAIDDLCVASRAPAPDDLRVQRVQDLRPAALAGVDAIVHLAAWKSVPQSFVDRTVMRDNIEVDRHVLELVLARPVRRLVMASSCEVYGNASVALHEALPRAPRSPYAVGKVTTELLAAALAPLTPTQICCARLFNTFGPGEGLDAVVPCFVHDALRWRRVRIEGDGAQRRYFSHVDAVVEILARLLSVPSLPPVLNVGAGHEVSVAQIAATLGELLGRVAVERVPARPNEIAAFTPELSLLRATVGVVDALPFREALRDCVQWERQAQQHQPLADGRGVAVC